jgi:hypothetical protein
MLTLPLGVIRPIVLLPSFVNHSAPSTPFAIPSGLSMPRAAYVVTSPCVVMHPIVLLSKFVNHRAPSGPVVISNGPLRAFGLLGSPKLLICPLGETRPMPNS